MLKHGYSLFVKRAFLKIGRNGAQDIWVPWLSVSHILLVIMNVVKSKWPRGDERNRWVVYFGVPRPNTLCSSLSLSLCHFYLSSKALRAESTLPLKKQILSCNTFSFQYINCFPSLFHLILHVHTNTHSHTHTYIFVN